MKVDLVLKYEAKRDILVFQLFAHGRAAQDDVSSQTCVYARVGPWRPFAPLRPAAVIAAEVS